MDGFQDDEVTRFIACTSNVDRSIEHLVWWGANEEKFPTLANFARDILPVQSSPVASKSRLSSAGNLIEENRSHLSDDTIRACLRVHSRCGIVG